MNLLLIPILDGFYQFLLTSDKVTAIVRLYALRLASSCDKTPLSMIERISV